MAYSALASTKYLTQTTIFCIQESTRKSGQGSRSTTASGWSPGAIAATPGDEPGVSPQNQRPSNGISRRTPLGVEGIGGGVGHDAGRGELEDFAGPQAGRKGRARGSTQ